METVYYFIGTDEAGYGPNLGPLAVSMTLWRLANQTAPEGKSESVPQSGKKSRAVLSTKPGLPSPSDPISPPLRTRSLFDAFDETDIPEPVRRFDEENRTLTEWNWRLDTLCTLNGDFPVIDSKRLYHPGQLERLEYSFRLAAGLAGISAADFSALLNRIAPSEFPPPVWEKGGPLPFPACGQIEKSRNGRNSKKAVTPEKIEEVREKLHQTGTTLLAIQSRRIQPAQWNDRLDSGLLKSDILAETTMELASQGAAAAQNDARLFCPNGNVRYLILCDKLGGRNRYESLLSSFFSDSITPFCETDSLSRYEIGDKTVIRFQSKGESNRPTGLASIVSKYLRERSMEMWNRFWQEKIPNIRPTAGYPVDARRFMDEIKAYLPQTGIPLHAVWRNK